MPLPEKRRTRKRKPDQPNLLENNPVPTRASSLSQLSFFVPMFPVQQRKRHTPKGRLSHLHHPADRRRTRDYRPDPITGAGMVGQQHPAVMRSRHPSNLATAKLRGYISEIGDDTSTFTVVDTMIDPEWPADQRPLQPEGWVYLTLPDSFAPDLNFAAHHMRKNRRNCRRSNKLISRARQNSSRKTPAGHRPAREQCATRVAAGMT